MTTVLQQNVNMVIQLLNCSNVGDRMIVFRGYVICHMVKVKSFPIMKSRAIFKSYLEVWD